MRSEKDSYPGNEMESEEDKIVNIPHYQLSPRALTAIIEEFITRDGTDYGEREVPLEEKAQRVHRQIVAGKALILFDKETRKCTIVSRDDPRIKGLI